MEGQSGNMAVEMLKTTGEVADALEIAAAPLRLLYRVFVDRLEGEPDPEDTATAYVLERCLEDLTAIGEKAQEIDLSVRERQMKRFGPIVKRVRPDLTDKELADAWMDFFSGRTEKGAAHEDQ